MRRRRPIHACVLLLFASPSLAAPPTVFNTLQKPPAGLSDDMVAGPYRQRVLEILERPFLHSAPPTEAFRGDEALFNWLLDHPTWVAGLWREIGFKFGTVEATADGWNCAEDKLSAVQCHLLYRSPELRIVYCVVETSLPPLPGKFHGEAVLIHRTAVGRTGRLQQQSEAFMTAKGPTLNMLMRLARRTCERGAEQSLQETMTYFSLICRVIQLRPEWASATAGRLSARFPASEGAELRALIAQLPPSARDGKLKRMQPIETTGKIAPERNPGRTTVLAPFGTPTSN